MKKFDLNAYGVEEMGVNEMYIVDGGFFITPPFPIFFLVPIIVDYIMS